MSQKLFVSNNAEQWTKVLSKYEAILKLKASKMTRSSTKPRGGKDLLDLDNWFQTELPGVIQVRSPKYITKEELCKVMKWKLTRGKFRPRLTELVQTNSEDDVVKASKTAFSKLPKSRSAAITALSTLKAVGPATASAVLAAGSPDLVPFMADESMLAIPGIQPLDYKLNFFERYAEQVLSCVGRLNKACKSNEWTAHKVELALWTWYTAQQLDSSILDSNGGDGKKRKSTEDSARDKKSIKK